MILIHLHISCFPHHYNDHHEDWYSHQPEEPHNDEHTTSSIPLISVVPLKELCTTEVTTGKKKKVRIKEYNQSGYVHAYTSLVPRPIPSFSMLHAEKAGRPGIRSHMTLHHDEVKTSGQKVT